MRLYSLLIVLNPFHCPAEIPYSFALTRLFISIPFFLGTKIFMFVDFLHFLEAEEEFFQEDLPITFAPVL